MAVVSANIRKAGITGSRSGINRKLPDSSSYQVVWFVVTNDPADGPVVILSHFRTTPNLPYFGSVYSLGNERDTDNICTQIEPTPFGKSGLHWEVTFTYTRKIETELPTGTASFPPPPGDDNRFGEADDYEVSYSMISEPCWKAKYVTGFTGMSGHLWKRNTERPVHNSAGDIYNPPPEVDNVMRIVRITRSIAEFSSLTWEPWFNAVNSAEINVSRPAYRFYEFWDKYHTRFMPPSPRLSFLSDGTPYYRCTFEFWVHPRTWREEILDQGSKVAARPGESNGMGGQWSPGDFKKGMPPSMNPRGPNGEIVEGPFNLDGQGQILSEGAPPVWITWAKYTNEVDFAPLMDAIYNA